MRRRMIRGGDPELSALVGYLEAVLGDAGQEDLQAVGAFGLLNLELRPADLARVALAVFPGSVERRDECVEYRHVDFSFLLNPGAQLTDTVIFFGLASSFLGSVTVRMPFSYEAETLSAWTSSGIVNTLLSDAVFSPSPDFPLRDAWIERDPSTISTLIASRFTPGSSARTYVLSLSS